MDGYITTAQAAEELCVSQARVRQFISEGRLAAKKIGGVFLINSAELERFRLEPRIRTGRPKKSLR